MSKSVPNRTYRLLCLIFLSTCLSACFDSDVDNHTLLTLDPDVIPYFTTDHWVYATDVDGNILDVKKTIGKQLVTLTSTKPVDKFNLTIVSGSLDSNDTTYVSIITYADVEKGSRFKVTYSTGFTLKDPGEVAFKLSGYDGPPNGVSFANRSYYTDYTETISSGTFNADLTMYGLPSDVLLTTYRNGVPVYANVKGVTGGDRIELDMAADFTPFEHQRRLDFEGFHNSGSVAGAYLDADGKLASTYFNLIETYRLNGTKDDTQFPLIGYVDGFDIYRLSVVNFRSSGYVSYLKQGDIKSSFSDFTMPAFSFNTFDKDLRHFTFKFSEDFTYYIANFVHKEGKAHLGWAIHGPQNKDVIIGEVPAEILEAYPMIKPEAFKYSDCTLTKVISGDTYKDTILRIGDDLSKEVEYYMFTPFD